MLKLVAVVRKQFSGVRRPTVAAIGSS